MLAWVLAQTKKDFPGINLKSPLLCLTLTGQFLNHLLEKFRKIHELKAVIPVEMLQPAKLPRKLKVA